MKILKRHKRFVILSMIGLIVLSSLLAVFFYSSSYVRYYAICLQCGKQTYMTVSSYYGVAIQTEQAEVVPTPISSALSTRVDADHVHEWSKTLLTGVFGSFRGGMNCRGLHPYVWRLNKDEIFLQELADSPKGAEILRALVELEIYDYNEFLRLPLVAYERGELRTRPLLNVWWEQERERILEAIENKRP